MSETAAINTARTELDIRLPERHRPLHFVRCSTAFRSERPAKSMLPRTLPQHKSLFLAGPRTRGLQLLDIYISRDFLDGHGVWNDDMLCVLYRQRQLGIRSWVQSGLHLNIFIPQQC